MRDADRSPPTASSTLAKEVVLPDVARELLGGNDKQMPWWIPASS